MATHTCKNNDKIKLVVLFTLTVITRHVPRSYMAHNDLVNDLEIKSTRNVSPFMPWYYGLLCCSKSNTPITSDKLPILAADNHVFFMTRHYCKWLQKAVVPSQLLQRRNHSSPTPRLSAHTSPRVALIPTCLEPWLLVPWQHPPHV